MASTGVMPTPALISTSGRSGADGAMTKLPRGAATSNTSPTRARVCKYARRSVWLELDTDAVLGGVGRTGERIAAQNRTGVIWTCRQPNGHKLTGQRVR